MKLGKAVVTASTTLMIASVAYAANIAPNDVSFENDRVATSLTGVAGNPEEGAKIFANKKLGNCLACHVNSDQKKQLFQGNVGPELDGIGRRRNPEELRAIVSNSKAVFGPDTVMPGFYSLKVGVNVREDLVGKTILTAQQVEDVVAYLSTLK